MAVVQSTSLLCMCSPIACYNHLNSTLEMSLRRERISSKLLTIIATTARTRIVSLTTSQIFLALLLFTIPTPTTLIIQITSSQSRPFLLRNPCIHAFDNLLEPNLPYIMLRIPCAAAQKVVV